MKKEAIKLTIRDYLLTSFIAVSFSLFTIPILQNLKLPFIKSIPAAFAIELVFLLIFANIAIGIAGLIARKIPVMLQVAKFVAVGAFNTFLNWGIVNLLMWTTQIFSGALYTFYIAFAFIVANFVSFFWNRYWIFIPEKVKARESAKKDYVQFLIVSVIGLTIQTGISSAWVNLLPTEMTAEIWANIGLVMGTAFSMIWNFLGYKFIVFRK